MWLTVLILSFILFGPSQAGKNDGNCEIENFTDSSWLVNLEIPGKVYDNENNKIVYESPYTGSLTDLKCTCTSSTCNSNYEYITIKNNASAFIISTSDHMTDLDKDTEKTSNPSIKLVYSCEMTCNTDLPSILTVVIDTYDYNNHAPEFEVDSYTYKVASPIMPMSDFTLFGDTIEAEDLDFSNTNITFIIEPNDFIISTTVDYTNNKKYIANVRANKTIVLTESVTYKLTATDSGTDPNPLSTTIDIVIDVDESLSWDVPSFEYSDNSIAAYVFEYVSTSDQLNPLTGSIKLNTNKPNSIEDIQLLGEMKDYFTVDYVNDTKTFELSASTIENPTSSSTVLTLSLKTDFEISTPIIINFSNVSSDTVTFKEHSYTGSYDDVNNIVTMNEDIELTISTSGTPTFAITGDFSDNFSVEYDENTEVCTLTVDTALTPAQILSKVYLTLTLQASIDDDSDRTVIIIQLPTHTLEFSEILYTATYNDDDTVSIDATNPIAFTSAATGVSITVQEPYSTYFKVNEKLTIDVEEPLPSEILSTETEIAIVLTAEDAYSNKAQAVVKMALPLQETMEAPKFSQPYYIAEYNDTAEYIDFDEALAFDNIEDPSTVTIDLSAYSENFKLVYKNKKWIIQIDKQLDTDTFNNNNELILTMTATEKSSTAKGLGVLVVLLEKSDAPEFSQLSYLAQYTQGQTEFVDFEEPVEFQNVKDPNLITISLNAYEENFEVYYDTTTKKWRIKVKKALDSETFDTTSELVIKMTATETGNSKTGAAVLVMELIESTNEEEPKFSSISYIAQYTRGQTEDSDFTTDVSFTNVNDNTKIDIVLNSYDDNFKVYFDTTTKKWRIKIKKALDSETFDTTSELVIKMTATETGNSKTGAAVLVMELIDSTNEVEPKFSSISYIAQYTRGQTEDSDFTTDVSFTNVKDNTKIDIVLNSYDDNFKVYFDTTTKKWRIKIKKALDSETFDTTSELVIKMTATETGNSKTGAAVLVMELIDSTNEVEPKFSSISYIAQYTRGQTEDSDFTTDVSFTNVKDNTKIDIVLNSYEENFEVYYDTTTKKWRIKIKKALDSETFDTTSELVIKMTATETGNSKTGAAVLVMELIDSTNEVEPKFSSISYIAQYTRGQTEDSDFTTDVSFTNVKDNTKIDIVLNSYDDNFKVYFDTTTKKWRIKIKKALDSETFDTTSELVIKMTATETGNSKTGAAVLVMELIDSTNEVEPKFSSISYIAQYTRGQTEDSDFTTDVSFTNVKDNTKIDIVLNSYDDNFKVYFDTTTKKWRIKIKKALDSETFDTTSELVIKMTATETGNSKTGAAVLVMELIDSTNEVEPKFSSISYIAQYTRGQTEDSDFTTDVSFTNVKDNTKIDIVLNSYDDNFKVYFDTTTKKWRIKIKKALDSETFDTTSELVIKMTATETGNSKTGAAVLVMELIDSTNEVEPKFSSISYIAQYTRGQTEDSDFTTDVSFTNVKDNTKIDIVLNSYDDNFKVYFDTTTKKWRIKIKKALDSETFDTTSELVIKMTATETGNSKTGAAVLVMELIDSTNEVEPKFSSISYIAQYTRGQTEDSDFTTDVSFTNVKDNTKIDIVLNSYDDNFKVYFDTTTKKWRIKIKKALDSETFDTTSELVIKMTATETGNSKTGAAVLVMELIDSTNEVEPKFSSISYIAQYTRGQTEDSDFTTDVSFTNVKDNTKIDIVLNSYDDNFKVYFDTTTKKWRIKIKKALDSETFDTTSELVIKMTATETGNSKTGAAVLVMELIDSTNEVEPKFSSISYIAQYTRGQTEDSDFTTDVSFTNVKDNTKIDIVLNSYEENFEVYYDTTTKKWRIKIKKALDSETFDTTSELVIKMTATETGNSKTGAAVLVMELIDSTDEDALQYSNIFYVAQYTENLNSTYIDFDKSILFKSDEDMSKISIDIDDYINNFEVIYTDQKWRLHVKTPLDNTVLDVKQDLILIMTATQTETSRTGKSVLIIELIEDSVDPKIPQFEDAYYTAIYPDDGTGPISFVNDIIFVNVDDISKVTITISDYADYFNVAYDTTSTKWLINIETPLDDATLSSNTYLTSTLTAQIDGDEQHTPVAGLVLKLPVQEAPIFSKSYFVAQYTIEDNEAQVTFEDQIEFSNEVDIDKIEIISDEYSNYLSFEYNTEKNQWEVKTNGILDTTSLDRLNLVVAITATDTTTNLQGRSVIDLKLPKVNEEDAPRFSKTYYKANYDLSTGQPDVILEDTIDFLNRNDMSTISITTNNYTENFKVSYTDDKWKITVTKNLDQSILNNRVDIIMELIASDSTDSSSIGQATLLITLPVVNNDDAPKFSSIFYESQCNSTTEILETFPTITINNKEDLSQINVNILENDYQSNFEIQYKSATQSWEISVISLPEDIEQLGKSLVLTLTASEPENTNIGQAALIINFPALDAPKFSSDQYFGKYEIIEDTASFTMEDVIITNRNNQSNIILKLSSPDEDLSGNFKYTFDEEKEIWKITLEQSLDDDFINGKTQLILTLTASEDYNTNEGFATVVINLPNEDTENDLTFSSTHYEGDYSIVENEAIVELNEKIQLISTKDLTSVLFLFVVSDNIDANDYFSIDETSNTGYYDVKILKELPASILQNQRNLVVTLQATLGRSKSSTTLVINLPIPGEENTIEFSKLLYNGNYSSGEVTVEDITIITNEISGHLEVTISKDSPYESYFSVTLNEKTVTLTAANIPSDVLESITVIPLTLQAVSSGTSKTGTAIVNIDTKYYRGSLQFSSVVFNGKYDVINNDELTVDPIHLITDVEDDLISVTLDNAIASYIDIFYNSSEVYLTLNSNFPDEFLQNSTLTLVLTATILETDIKSQAVVNLRIISDTQPDTEGNLKFNDILFNAQYSVQNGKGIFKQDGDIGLTTDRLEDEIVIQFSEASPLKEHFNISYKNQKVTVSLKDNIPDDDFRSRKLIPLTMIASTTSNSISTSAVLNVILNNDGTIDNGYISFGSVVYNGKYTVENNIAAIDYDNNITVSTDQEDSKIVATIEQPFNAYFNVVYLNKLIKLNLLTTSASTTLRSNKNLPVVVTVQIEDTSQYSSSVINFVVVDTDNGDEDNGSINFPSQIYNGVYDVDSNSFTRDVIRIITDHPDGDIEVKISNEYNLDTYFEVEYKINEIFIDLKKELPKNDVKNLGSIALAIRARLKNHQNIYGDSVLNIKIQDKSLDNEGSSNTKYIVAVSVLSVLLFLVIIGVIAFYILIFRKRKYEKMTEEEYMNSKVKFDKSAMKRPSSEKTRSSAIEERRPTGYVFTNTDSADVKEPNTDTLENTRKKSVAFDENVKKLQIDGVNDEDIERALGETTEL